jgi:hypothetical protein
MFDKPTINDFLALLRTETNNAVTTLGKEAQALDRQYNARGMYRSGGMVTALLDTSGTAFREHLGQILTTVGKVVREGNLDAKELRDTAVQHLQQLPQLMRNASGVDRLIDGDRDSVKAVIDGHFEKLAELMRTQIRQFDIGWAGGADSAAGGIYNAGTIIGGVQQHSPGATMSVNVSINFAEAQRAAEELANALAAVPQEVPIIDMRADVDTVRAQLGKSTPSPIVLREAGSTLRSLGEGVAAGLLTPVAAAALAALLKALGLN